MSQVALDFYARGAVDLAQALLGCLIEHEVDGQICGGFISETEAYTEDDEASHSFRGMTPRNQAMFAQPGTIYVYRSYGLHFCMNISSGAEGRGEAVLLRAIVPSEGLSLMRSRRKWPEPKALRDLANGPGKLTAALGIGLELNGSLLTGNSPLHVKQGRPVSLEAIQSGPRIGISKAKEKPWRFWVKATEWS